MAPLAIMAIGAIGCGGKAVAQYDTPSASSIGLTTTDSGLRVGELRESGVLAAEHFWTDTERRDRFLRFTSDSSEPERVLRTIMPEGDGVIRIEFGGESSEPNWARIVLAESGDILIDSNLANGIESTFEPQALFLPAVLNAGDDVVREIAVESKGGLFGSGSGGGTSTVSGIGTQVIEVPAGVYEAFVVDSQLAFSVGPARIKLTQRAWFALNVSGVGVVAEEGEELVRVFGVTAHRQSRVSVLTETRVRD